MIMAGIGMTIGNFAGAKLSEKLTPVYATILALCMMAAGLLTNAFTASDKTSVLIMTFLIGVIAFCLSAPVQLMMINTAKESKMLGSSLNQSAFNIGNAAGPISQVCPLHLATDLHLQVWLGPYWQRQGSLLLSGSYLSGAKK